MWVLNLAHARYGRFRDQGLTLTWGKDQHLGKQLLVANENDQMRVGSCRFAERRYDLPVDIMSASLKNHLQSG